MTVPDRTQFERELRDRLWNEGWFVSRTAGSGTWDKPAVDLVAIRNECVLLFEVKTVSEGSTLDVSEDSEQLQVALKRATGQDCWSTSMNVSAVFAIRRMGNRSWYWKPATTTEISFDDSMEKLTMLLLQR